MSARVSVCTDFGKRSLRLHDAAFVLVVMRILKSESLLWSVFFQVRQLLAVDGSSALPVGTEKGRTVSGVPGEDPPPQATLVGVLNSPAWSRKGFLRLQPHASSGDGDRHRPQWLFLLIHPMSLRTRRAREETRGEAAQRGVPAKNPLRMLPDASPASHSPDAKAQGAWCWPPLFFHAKRREKQPRCPKKPLRHTRSLHSLREGLLSPPTPKRRSTYCRMNWMASSYFIPLSIKASATRTGALKGNSSGSHSPVMWPRS